MAKPKKTVKKMAKVAKAAKFKISASAVRDTENKIRDLINQIKVYNEEELEVGEGKKVEDDAAENIVEKLKDIARTIGIGALE